MLAVTLSQCIGVPEGIERKIQIVTDDKNSGVWRALFAKLRVQFSEDL